MKRLKSDPARIVIPEIGALACTSWLSAHGERSCMLCTMMAFKCSSYLSVGTGQLERRWVARP